MTTTQGTPEAPRPLLAEALEQNADTVPEPSVSSMTDANWDTIAAAILATPAGARLLALAETGAAVERLGAALLPDHSHAAIFLNRAVIDIAPFMATLYPYQGAWQEGSGKTLPEAVAAALEARDDG